MSLARAAFPPSAPSVRPSPSCCFNELSRSPSLICQLIFSSMLEASGSLPRGAFPDGLIVLFLPRQEASPLEIYNARYFIIAHTVRTSKPLRRLCLPRYPLISRQRRKPGCRLIRLPSTKFSHCLRQVELVEEYRRQPACQMAFAEVHDQSSEPCYSIAFDKQQPPLQMYK